MNENEPIVRLTFDAAKLFADHPGKMFNRNKQLVYDTACPPNCVHRGTLEFTRWREMRLPERVPAAAPKIEPRADVYGYENPVPGGSEWYVNFADENLFGYYRGALLAQDELQVAEHPGLGALREELIGKVAISTFHDGRPTPVLIAGVERRCALMLTPDAALGRPNGLYGNRFGQGPAAAIQNAIRVIDPPTVSNILAIAAPAHGNGGYRSEEIELILATAYTGFRAAKLESKGALTIHTGFWGCGAFGGNRELMALLQILAARLAGADRVVFHTFNGDGLKDCAAAQAQLDRLLNREPLPTVSELIDEIQKIGYKWGVSDGN